jgi:hypothetical protein
VTTQQLLRFCGAVLGPALLGQATAELFAALPPIAPPRGGVADKRAAVDALLEQAFPDGLAL